MHLQFKRFIGSILSFIILSWLVPIIVLSQEDAEWTVYKGHYTTDIAIEGNFIWVTGSNGLIKMDKITGAKSNYNKSNSDLPDDNLYCITIDQNGDKWIGSYYGLVKFDGINWTVFNTSNSGLPNNVVNCITIDNNGDKWIGTLKGGIAKYANKNWTVYNSSNSDLPDYNVNCITIDDNGDRWIGTEGGGIAKINGINWTIYNTQNSSLPDDYITSITIDGNGIKWIGTSGGLANLDGINWTVYNTSNSGLPSNYIDCITIDINGNKWIGTHTNGIAKYDGTYWTVYNSSSSGLPSDEGICITIDDNGDKWIGTWGGMVKFDGSNWILYDLNYLGLHLLSVTCVTIDNNNDKWIGTWEGIVKFNGSNWTIYDTSNSDLPDDFVECITKDNNNDKWIGTWGGGLAKFDGKNWIVYNTSNSGLPSDHVRCITIDSVGNKWIGTWGGGLAKFDNINWTEFDTSNSGLPSEYIRCITIDSNDDKWIGTYKGLAKFDGTNWTVYNPLNSGLPDDFVYCITIDGNGDKWIGTEYGGLAKYEGTNWTVYNPSNSGLPDDYIYCITIDSNGDKWIGTGDPFVDGGGMTKFDGTNWTVYNTSNSGIPCDDVQCITFDAGGNKWIGTFTGGLAYFSEKIYPEKIDSINCSGKNIGIEFTTKEQFNPDNIFTVQLSDSTGMFYNDSIPIVLGSLAGREGGTINVTMPKDIPYGTKYRIRVSASSPYARGVDNGEDITIYPLPKPEIVKSIDTVYPGSTIEYESNFSIEYIWKVSGGEIESDTSKDKISVKWGSPGKGKITLIQTNENRCIDSVTKEITILSIMPDITGKNKVCENTLENYKSNRIQEAELLWSVTSGGTLIGDSTADSIVVEWSNAGAGTVKLTQILNEYSEERTMNADIQPKPERPTIESAGSKLISSSLTGNQWFHNDTLLTGATNNILEPTILSGYYQVQVTGANGCVSEMSEKYDYDRNPQVSFQIGDGVLKAKPGEEIDVPIYILSDDDIDTSGLKTIEARLRYNYTLLKPLGDNQGTISNGERLINLNMQYKKQEFLQTLPFKAELGNSITTDLILDSIRFTGAALSLSQNEYKGKFELTGVCMEGGYPRLINNSGQVGLILLSPNPSTESFEIEYELIEKGSTKIYICNAFGEVVKTILESETVKTGKDKMTISTSDLPTGMYFVILQTPTIRKAEKLEIIR